MENFTVKELDILIAAMEAWADEDTDKFLIHGMVKAAFLQDGMSEIERMEAHLKDRQELHDIVQNRASKQEQATLIKAKLIKLKQAVILSEANIILNAENKK